jgi:hypothetical protein
MPSQHGQLIIQGYITTLVLRDTTLLSCIGERQSNHVTATNNKHTRTGIEFGNRKNPLVYRIELVLTELY